MRGDVALWDVQQQQPGEGCLAGPRATCCHIESAHGHHHTHTTPTPQAPAPTQQTLRNKKYTHTHTQFSTFLRRKAHDAPDDTSVIQAK